MQSENLREVGRMSSSRWGVVKNLCCEHTSLALKFENAETQTRTMASEYWFCRFYDEARLKNGLPGFDIETGIHYYCPKQFSSFIAFKTHAGKVHRGRSDSRLRFKHVIAQPPKERLGVHYLCCVRLIGRTQNIIMQVTCF